MDFNQPSIYLKPSFSPKKVEAKAAHYDMIVFSPVRWNFIYQRPQHIVSRMANKRNVLFVELPIESNSKDKGQINLTSINDQITVLQAKVDTLSELRDIIASYITNDVVPLGLFFSPVFSSFLEVFLFDKVVYDCVNDPFNSTDQSFEMTERENHLIAESDLVLTNEQMIYDSKYLDHPNVHCIKKADQPLAVAIIDRMTERMEVLISSSRNYGVRI
ncbi:MAG: tuaH [Chitinophagaceae bacterium]|nr:tuaH [Chitinophagaceae bacterium]